MPRYTDTARDAAGRPVGAARFHITRVLSGQTPPTADTPGVPAVHQLLHRGRTGRDGSFYADLATEPGQRYTLTVISVGGERLTDEFRGAAPGRGYTVAPIVDQLIRPRPVPRSPRSGAGPDPDRPRGGNPRMTSHREGPR